MTTVAIAEAKIKLAFREKYLTDGVNERELSVPRGAYRGYRLAPRLSPDTWLRLLIDPDGTGRDTDQFAIYGHRDDGTGLEGFSVSIREVTDVEFDCADLFPVVGATEDWYVYIEAAYSPNTTTTANYRVAKTDPRIANPDAVILGILPMTLGDLAIDFDPLVDGALVPPAGIYAQRTMPVPTARQTYGDFAAGDELWGLIDGVMRWAVGTGLTGLALAEPTMVAVVLAPGAVKFQLTGRFYVGNGATTTGGKHFRLFDGSTSLNTPVRALTDNGLIAANYTLLLSDGITTLTPSVHADAEGFYDSPWVQFDFANTVDTSYPGPLRVLCYKKKTLATLENNPAGAFPIGDIESMPHSRRVVTKQNAGTPDSLTSSDLDAQLLALLGFVNARIESVHYDSTPGNWVLLWRSHHAHVDGDVTKQTSSIYFGDAGLLLLTGGYLKISDGKVYAGTGTAAYDVTGIYFKSLTTNGGIYIGRKNGPAAGSSWEVDTQDPVTGWDQLIEFTGAMSLLGTPLFPNSGVVWAQSLAPDAFNVVYPSSVSGSDWVKFLETFNVYGTYPQYRQYFSQYGMMFAVNCSCSGTMPGVVWTPDDTSWDAYIFLIGLSGMIIYKKEHSGMPASWTNLEWDSSTTVGGSWGGGMIACNKVGGFTYEKIRFGGYGQTIEVGPDNYVFFHASLNFRSYYCVAPDETGGDFTFDAPPNGARKVTRPYQNWIGGAVSYFDFDATDIYDVGNWGFCIFKQFTTGEILGSRWQYDGNITIEVS